MCAHDKRARVLAEPKPFVREACLEKIRLERNRLKNHQATASDFNSRARDAYVTRKVYSETTGRGGFPDSLMIKDVVDGGGLRLYDVKDMRAVEALSRHPEIHVGEAETLAAAKELDGLAVIDDKGARTLARVYGIRSAPGTLFLLFRLLSF